VGAKSKRGRPKKAPAKVSRLNSKLDVLEYLASVYQDESQPTEIRLRAAAMFAPYRYPRLQAQHVTHDNGGQTHEQWVKLMHRALTESDEPELKLIEGEAVELGGAPDVSSGGQGENR
jgi:hypothetical protein